LARAVGDQETEDGAAFDLKVHAAQRFDLAEALLDAADLDDRLHRPREAASPVRTLMGRRAGFRPMARPDQSVYPPERIPPGQFVTEKFPVLHAGHVPRFDPATWDFRVYGAVENPVKLS